jgi:hypothetical protein
MAQIVVSGDTSGSVTLQAPAVSGSSVLTLPVATDTLVGKATTDVLSNKTLASTVVQASNAAPAFSAYQSTLQAIPVTTPTKVLFQTEEFDTNNNFASSTFTPTVAGYYQVNAAVTTAGNSSVGVWIWKNGAAYKQGGYVANNYPGNSGACSSIVYFNGSTDYVEIYVYQNVAANTSPAISATWFNAAMIRSA